MIGVCGTEGEDIGGESGISIRPQPFSEWVSLGFRSGKEGRNNLSEDVPDDSTERGLSVGIRELGAMGETERRFKATRRLAPPVSDSASERLPLHVPLPSASEGERDDIED